MTSLSLEQCKVLEALGFPQNTYFCWSDHYEPGVTFLLRERDSYAEAGIFYASPLLEELLEWLGMPYRLMHSPDDTYHATCRGEDEKGRTGEYAGESRSSVLRAVYNLALAVKGNKHNEEA